MKNTNLEFLVENNPELFNANSPLDNASTNGDEINLNGDIKLSAIPISKKISLYNINLLKRDNPHLTLSKGENQPLSFVYCKSGSLSISFSNRGPQKYLSKFQTAIISGNVDDRVRLSSNSNEPCNVTVISIEKK